jgi:RNA-binding protein Nova
MNSFAFPHIADISPPQYSTLGQTVTMEMGIADGLIGAILGRGGQAVKEIMEHSGTMVQVSQKGVYMPGTKYRSVKVVGLQSQVQIALSLIMSKLQS